MTLIVFDDADSDRLLPFTHTRPAADIRCGILTGRARWERLLGFRESYTITGPHLRGSYPPPAGNGDYLLVNGRIIGTPELTVAIQSLEPGAAWMGDDSSLIAARLSGAAPVQLPFIPPGFKEMQWKKPLMMLERPWDIFSLNDAALRLDYTLLTRGRISASIPDDVIVRGAEIFIEDSATIGAGTVINATAGQVYIGAGAEIMEGCMIRGPFALSENATLKMGAKVYGGTTIGPGCKIGGEVSNVVFFANSNKGHDGFLGNAVIGEWCNLGADTNCSNLKNNYDEIKIWDEAQMKSVKTGLTFCGLLMGDHSKCGINTMFNTGTVVGVSCNIWGGGFPEKFVPSFSWGGPDGMTTYSFARAADTANRMMARRGKSLTAAETAILQDVFDKTKAQRDLLHHS